jgi:hypothetical protein
MKIICVALRVECAGLPNACPVSILPRKLHRVAADVRRLILLE